MTVIEIISAIRNEEKSLPLFVERIRALTLPEGVELRITFIEDSSTDGTRDILRDLSATHADIGFYSLEQAFGQGPAIIFGLSRSTSDAAILMDADGSHPPEVIPEMIALHLRGAGVVQCVRRTLTDRPVYRRLATTIFQTLASWIVRVDLAEQSVFYRLVSPRFAEDLVSDPRYWRFLRFPLPSTPGELARLEIDTAERTHDESKYGPFRLLGLAIDAILSLVSPVRMWAGVGIVALGAVALIRLGAWPVAIVLALAVVAAGRRYHQLRSLRLLDRMEVRESANVPERSAHS